MRTWMGCGAAALCLVLASGGQAQTPPQPTGQPSGMPSGESGGRHRGPPPQALEACKNLQAGADCSFTARDRTRKGSCFAPEGKPLACRPKHQHDRPGGPPADGASGPRR